MRKYKVKTVEAEALEFDPEKAEDDNGRTNADELAELCGGRVYWVERDGNTVPQVAFPAKSGTKVANVGDYLVKLNENEFTSMTAKDFEAKYEATR